MLVVKYFHPRHVGVWVFFDGFRARKARGMGELLADILPQLLGHFDVAIIRIAEKIVRYDERVSCVKCAVNNKTYVIWIVRYSSFLPVGDGHCFFETHHPTRVWVKGLANI
jgi:CRISPR/Cas system CMR-associated protein Cmr1 (group 7 of RAMP superfamily)